MEEKRTPSAPVQAAGTESGNAANKRRRRRGGRRHGGNKPAPAQPGTEAPSQPVQNVAKQQPAQPVKKLPATEEKDDSLQVISRKTPVQKFASFEDYMKARETEEE